MVKAVVGANWGDEGKGKITDMLAKDADIVVRFQGGANAGHTIVNEYGKFALHLLPSGSFNKNVTNVIGNGVALDIPRLFDEIKSIEDRGVPKPNIVVSERAQVLMPYHVLLDTYEEERLSDRKFGSTKSGIAPFYSDKYAKIGFQVWELLQDDDKLFEKVKNTLEIKNLIIEHVYHKPTLDPQELFETLKKYREMIKPYVINTAVFMNKAIKEGKTILLEGQLGSLKDPDMGIYPFTTSSHTLAGYGACGACTTGRPRRMGWLDCVATRYGCMVQGTTEVAFTVLDVLGYLDEIPVCVGYEYDGIISKDFPTTDKLNIAKPVFEKLPGWKCDIRGIKKYEDLPENCRNYIEFVEKEIGYPIKIVSNGPARDDIIFR